MTNQFGTHDYFQVGGMTPSSYDPELDPTGLIGITLADHVSRQIEEERLLALGEEHQDRKYRSFLFSSQGIDIRPFRDTGKKRALLLDHFPRRFGSKGSQPLTRYSPKQIGHIFSELHRYSQKQVSSRP